MRPSLSVRLARGLRVGRDSKGQLSVSVALGPIRGRWALPMSKAKPDRDDQVYRALKALSYSSTEIDEVWPEVPKDGPTIERLRAALKLLAKRPE